MKIPRPKTRRAQVVTALVALAAVGGGTFWYLSAQEAGRPEVELTTVTRARITDSLVAVGDIQARDRSTITLVPTVKVTDVLVTKGQRVARGDILAVLDTSEYARQLEQQGISLADAEATLRYISGPSASNNATSADNAVSQAGIALQNAQAAADAARQRLADTPDLSDAAVRQAEIALEGAEANADAAAEAVDSTRELNDNAVRQAGIALDTARRARDAAAHDLAALKDKLLAGLITQAQYDAQLPALRSGLLTAESACRTAQVALDSARVTADAAQARAEQAAADADRAVVSAEAALDAAVRQAEVELDAAERAVGDADRAVDSAEVALAGARSGAGFARATDGQRASTQRSQVDLLDASIRYLWDKIDEGRLRAAVDGVVSRVDAEAGQYPEAGDTIVVDGSSGLVAAVEVPQADSLGLVPGQRATVTLKGIGTSFQGSVSAVAPTAERSATSADRDPKVLVDVTLLDADASVKVGYEADVEVFRDDKPDAVRVALDAVRTEPGTGNRYVFVVDERNRVSKVGIRTGIESEDQVEVLSGLAEGQHCVVDPADTLTDGTTVRIAGGGR